MARFDKENKNNKYNKDNKENQGNEKIKRQLTDVFYNESHMTDKLRNELENSSELQNHWNSLGLINESLEEELKQMADNHTTDKVLINAAFAQAEDVINEKSRKRQFALFLTFAFFILAIMGMLVATGNESIIVYEQITLTVIALLSLPFVIRYRLKKEW